MELIFACRVAAFRQSMIILRQYDVPIGPAKAKGTYSCNPGCLLLWPALGAGRNVDCIFIPSECLCRLAEMRIAREMAMIDEASTLLLLGLPV